ncbi:MAG: hypothetical protein AB8B91_10740 [Rubripirellula sp.]
MSGTKVVCPGCNLTMQLPDSAGSGKVMCPGCGMVLAIRTPGTPTKKPVNRDVFAEVPSFQTARSAPPPPPAFRSQTNRPAPVHRAATTQPQGYHAQQQPRRRSSGNSVAKVLGIIAASGLGVVLICGGAVVFFAVLGNMHSGWETAMFHGCTIKVPPGKELREKTTTLPGGFVVHEVLYRRRESGSQYILMVSDQLPAKLRNAKITQLVTNLSVGLVNEEMVLRSGVNGVKGTIARGGRGFNDCQAEYFVRDGRMIVTLYAPYSAIKERVGGQRDPRSNELALDQPEEFFESLSFR